MFATIAIFSLVIVVGLFAVGLLTRRPRQITQRGWVAFPDSHQQNPALVARAERETLAMHAAARRQYVAFVQDANAKTDLHIAKGRLW